MFPPGLVMALGLAMVLVVVLAMTLAGYGSGYGTDERDAGPCLDQLLNLHLEPDLQLDDMGEDI